ncbi:MAG: oxidase [Acidobacteria bacterium]|nr:MAG: oxidase [Acidobacteriota bacterium]
MTEHIVSPKIYAVIFLALMVGTFLTVFAAGRDFGRMNVVIALGIATIKATLVILFFMHGKYSSRRTKLVIVSGFFWLAIMLGLTIADYSTRHAEPSRSQLNESTTSSLMRS